MTALPHLFTAQQAALSELMRGMDADARWVLLIGEQGSGRSTVIRALLGELRVAAATVAEFQGRTDRDVDALASGLRQQLGLPPKRKLLGIDRSVVDILASQTTAGAPLVVVIDDADSVSAAAVTWLARLAAKAARTANACYVVLAGSPALEKTANRAWGSGNRSVRSVLGPMTAGEVHRYVEHCSAEASVKFSPAAIQSVGQHAKGRPGVIAQLCARAAILPSSRITEHVSSDAVAETAARMGLSDARNASAKGETDIERGTRRHVARRLALVFGATVLGALVLYVGVRFASRLTETSTRSLEWVVEMFDPASPARVQTPDPPRRETAARTGRNRAAAVASVPAVQPVRESRPVERPETQQASSRTDQQVAALMARAREGDTGELRRLLSSGVSPNVRDVGDFTALMAAVVNNQLPAARTLVEQGADVNARAHGGITALMLAVINDRPDAARLLLERGADVNAQSGAGWTALTFALWKGDTALERMLLGHGARPNVIDKQGWRPLEYAAPKLGPTDIDARVEGDRGGPSDAASPSASGTR